MFGLFTRHSYGETEKRLSLEDEGTVRAQVGCDDHEHLDCFSAMAMSGDPPGSDCMAVRNSSGEADLCWEQEWLSHPTGGKKELWKS